MGRCREALSEVTRKSYASHSLILYATLGLGWALSKKEWMKALVMSMSVYGHLGLWESPKGLFLLHIVPFSCTKSPLEHSQSPKHLSHRTSACIAFCNLSVTNTTDPLTSNDALLIPLADYSPGFLPYPQSPRSFSHCTIIICLGTVDVLKIASEIYSSLPP